MSQNKKKKVSPKKTPMIEEPPRERARNFEEVSKGYSAEQAMEEANRCLQCKKPRCIDGCPVHVPIPQFIARIREKDFEGAIKAIKKKNILPAVCGRVCPQENQCEALCLLGNKNEPVAIGRLERFAADWELANTEPREAAEDLPEPTGKRVAIVGSGPSGLTCAFDLAQLGHDVTVYEAFHEPGGVLVYGIPEFRLPKKRVVAREIAALRELGVNIVLNSVIGKLININELRADFDAVYIATGAGLPRFMSLEGENLNGVYSANEYLTRVNLMRAYDRSYDTPVVRAKRVAVIGGGNVAMDAVRTALRLGAEEATIVYRRSEEEMPARNEEIEHAREEGVRFELLTNPLRILGDDGWVRALECQRMELGSPDDTGRRRPEPIAGSEFLLEVDLVIIAIGATANPLVQQSEPDLAVNDRGYIVTEEETGKTNLEGVYAGGDIVTGSATVISAMGAGRRAAAAIDAYLSTS